MVLLDAHKAPIRTSRCSPESLPPPPSAPYPSSSVRRPDRPRPWHFPGPELPRQPPPSPPSTCFRSPPPPDVPSPLRKIPIITSPPMPSRSPATMTWTSPSTRRTACITLCRSSAPSRSAAWWSLTEKVRTNYREAKKDRVG